LGSSAPQNQKGPQGPFLRTAAFAGGLATGGGAPSYNHELGNKIAHCWPIWSFPCEAVIGVRCATVKQKGPMRSYWSPGLRDPLSDEITRLI
jgi:hypothetical protein